MEQRKLVWDIDGVIKDLESYMVTKGKIFFKIINIFRKKKKRVINYSGENIKEIFNCGKILEGIFWVTHLKNYTSLKTRTDISALMHKLTNEYNFHHIIATSRVLTTAPLIGKIVQKMVIKELKINNIPYENIEFCSIKKSKHEKKQICEKYKAWGFVEDTIENAEEISKLKVNGFLFLNSYNKNNNNNNISKVKNGDDLFCQIVEKITNNSLFDPNKGVLKNEKNYKDSIHYYQNLPYDKTKIENCNIKNLKVSSFLSPIFDKKINYIVVRKPNFDVTKIHNCIFTCNHRSIIDLALLMRIIGSGTSTHILLKKELEDIKLIGKFLTEIGGYFVKRGNKLSEYEAKMQSLKMLSHGENLIICPEGTRNRSKIPYSLNEFKPGAVSYAKKIGSTVFPSAIHYDDFLKTIFVIIDEGYKINFGQSTLIANEELKEKTQKLLEEIKDYKEKNIVKQLNKK